MLKEGLHFVKGELTQRRRADRVEGGQVGLAADDEDGMGHESVTQTNSIH